MKLTVYSAPPSSWPNYLAQPNYLYRSSLSMHECTIPPSPHVSSRSAVLKWIRQGIRQGALDERQRRPMAEYLRRHGMPYSSSNPCPSAVATSGVAGLSFSEHRRLGPCYFSSLYISDVLLWYVEQFVLYNVTNFDLVLWLWYYAPSLSYLLYIIQLQTYDDIINCIPSVSKCNMF